MSLPSTYDAWRTASPDDDGPDFEDAMSDEQIADVLQAFS